MGAELTSSPQAELNTALVIHRHPRHRSMGMMKELLVVILVVMVTRVHSAPGGDTDLNNQPQGSIKTVDQAQDSISSNVLQMFRSVREAGKADDKNRPKKKNKKGERKSKKGERKSKKGER